MYYVRCATRSSGASLKGTPEQALRYITDAHDNERDPSYSREELAYIARLDPGWKTDLEGGRVPLVGLGSLWGTEDSATLACQFLAACQPFHDIRGSTGYLSYTFTMPKELSLLSEGHPVQSRLAMYAALQTTLDAAFPGKRYRAVAAVHARNEAGEVHYHAHVLIGKFAFDTARRRTFSLNSRSGGNLGKERVATLKRVWKERLDAELEQRLGLAVTQTTAFAAPTITLPDGKAIQPLTRQSRRILDKFLCEQISRSTRDGGTSLTFRWTRLDATIYELASSPKAAGWNAGAFRELFPELSKRLGMYEARVATLKRIGYLDDAGKVTDAFTLHFTAHTGDHPKLRRLLADLEKAAGRGRRSGGGGMGGGIPPSPPPITSEASAAGDTAPDPDADLWLAFHRRQQFASRLDRLDVSPEAFRQRIQTTRQAQPTSARLEQIRLEERSRPAAPATSSTPARPGIIRAYCVLQGARVNTVFVLSKGLMTLTPGRSAELARKMLEHARSNYLMSKEQLLATAARRMRPLAFLGKLAMPADFERLELALRRCSSLPSTGQWGHLFQRQMRRAYRNSRDALQTQLREQQARASIKNLHPAEESRRPVERLLDRERRAPPVAIPASMAALADDIRRANARAHAVGLGAPFDAEVLMALSVASVTRALKQLREAGALCDSLHWAAREAVRPVTASLLSQTATVLRAQAQDLER